MTIKLDACGLSCPEPVLKLKQVIHKADKIEMLVDCQVSLDNCSNFARQNGFQVSVADDGDYYTLTLSKE